MVKIPILVPRPFSLGKSKPALHENQEFCEQVIEKMISFSAAMPEMALNNCYSFLSFLFTCDICLSPSDLLRYMSLYGTLGPVYWLWILLYDTSAIPLFLQNNCYIVAFVQCAVFESVFFHSGPIKYHRVSQSLISQINKMLSVCLSS